MSEEKANITGPDGATVSQTQAVGADADKLSGLMADGAAGKSPDLDAEALVAAEQALADGERALAAARELMSESAASRQRSDGSATTTAEPARRRRELALRLLLAVNVLAMVIIAALPLPEDDHGGVAPPQQHVETPESAVPTPRFNEPWNRALAAAERHDYASAVATLQGYLADSPRMPPSQKLSVYSALAYYAARNDDFKLSQEFTRRAQAIDQSHSLPDDLVSMAEAALASGDQETLRRVWARFLLKQQEIPSWLYKHVAEAYLQLGDSYRKDADAAAEKVRLEELKAAAEQLRGEVDGKSGEKR